MSEMPHYPASDFPYTFYFNGKSMPKWGACWMSCQLLTHAIDEITQHYESWALRLDLLYCRIDHTGTVESEDPVWFRASARLLLKHLLLNETLFAQQATEWGKHYGTPDGQTVIHDIRDTLIIAESLAAQDGFAAWTSGYPETQAWLCEYIRRAQLTPDAPDHRVWPHIATERMDAQHALVFTRKNLVKLLHNHTLDKTLRRAVHQMTDEAPQQQHQPNT